MWLSIAERLRHRFAPSAQGQMDQLESRLRENLTPQAREESKAQAKAWLEAHPYPSANDYVPPGTFVASHKTAVGRGTVKVPSEPAVPYEEFVKLRPSN
jgi:hypothetical protein